jgi:transcriptional regulator with XRE-family HTH domain
MGELLVGCTWDEVAARVGCSRSTVARRARDAGFRQRLADERSARLRRLADRLTDVSLAAVDLLAEVVADPSAPPATRVRAAAWILRLGAHVREEGQLEARVTALEQHARASGLRGVGTAR